MHALLARGLMQFGFWSVLSGGTAAVAVSCTGDMVSCHCHRPPLPEQK